MVVYSCLHCHQNAYDRNTSVVAVYRVVVIWPFGCDVTLLIVVAACCFAIHSTSAVVAKARG